MTTDFYLNLGDQKMKSYNEQRYERLRDSIEEYLTTDGEDCGVNALFRDIKKSCIDMKGYYQKVTEDITLVEEYF